MPDSLNDKIKVLSDKLGVELAQDFEDSVNQALKDGAKRGTPPQQAGLQFNPLVTYPNGGIDLKIVASGDYWIDIEKGRRAGRKAPPSKVFGKKWQGKNNINPSKIIYDLTVKYNQKQGFTKRNVKKLPFEKAANQFAFLVSRAIKQNGIEPKPFVERVVNNGKIDKFKKDIADLIGKQITLELTIGTK